MKFDEKVLTALEVLTDAAENDFELFRICTLVRDLIVPPVAEQVDDTHQRFNDVTYTKDKTGHYVRNMSLHQSIWRYYNGEVPADCDIHHANFKPGDNDITNLTPLTKAEHRRVHNHQAPIIMYTCKGCGKQFPSHNVGKNVKFCSVECRDKYKYTKKDSGVFEKRVCVVCGKEFKTEKRSTAKTCSKKCTATVRWTREQLTIPATCKWCGKSFETAKSNPASFCCRECYDKYLYATTLETRVCAACGKEFSTTKGDTSIVCSEECKKILLEKNVPTERKSRAKKIEIRTCPVCGKTFSTAEEHAGRFCCNICRQKYDRETKREVRTCKWCGKSFETFRRYHTQYCSRHCARKASNAKRHEKS